ncbi:hypothetical protein [Bartonella tribocorum]|uniref:Uncharacterized protein n=1 Tax=Bartonella tribocorum TaxID=85701 RepID=A0A2M6UW32_9HYPH|nr:hypothetical protein [Bartonella tribocorum]PIT70408.1 hypothetical protein CEV08_04285 [Bartonella tribocorum]
MYHKELFIRVAVSSTAFFFSSMTEIIKCSTQTSSHLSDSHESVVKGKYILSLYKLWQYAAKNKPSPYNEGIIHYNNKRYSLIKQIFTSYKCSLKRFLQLKNHIKQATSIKFQGPLLLKARIFFRHINNIDWRRLTYFIPSIDLVCWIFKDISNLLRKEKNNNNREYSKLNNSILQICKIKKQRENVPSKTGIYINKILYNKVYC